MKTSWQKEKVTCCCIFVFYFFCLIVRNVKSIQEHKIIFLRDVFIKCFETCFSQEMYSVSRSCWFWNFLSKESRFKKIQECKRIDHKDMFSWLFLFRWLHAILVRQFLTFIFLLLYLIFSTLYFLFFPFLIKEASLHKKKTWSCRSFCSIFLKLPSNSFWSRLGIGVISVTIFCWCICACAVI